MQEFRKIYEDDPKRLKDAQYRLDVLEKKLIEEKERRAKLQEILMNADAENRYKAGARARMLEDHLRKFVELSEDLTSLTDESFIYCAMHLTAVEHGLRKAKEAIEDEL